MSDKGQHVLLTYAVFLTGAVLFNIWVGIAGALLWSFGKEWIDKTQGKVFDWYDILADLLGLLAGVILIIEHRYVFVVFACILVVGLILIDKNK